MSSILKARNKIKKEKKEAEVARLEDYDRKQKIFKEELSIATKWLKKEMSALKKECSKTLLIRKISDEKVKKWNRKCHYGVEIKCKGWSGHFDSFVGALYVDHYHQFSSEGGYDYPRVHSKDIVCISSHWGEEFSVDRTRRAFNFTDRKRMTTDESLQQCIVDIIVSNLDEWL